MGLVKVGEDEDIPLTPPRHDFAIGLLSSGHPLRLKDTTMCYNGIVTGATGSGKTSGFCRPLLDWILRDPARPGALIVNVKDDYPEFVMSLAARYGISDRVVVLKPDGTEKMNLLNPAIDSYKLAEILVTSCIAPGELRHPLTAFWVQNGMRVLGMAIALARATIDPSEVTLEDIQTIVTEFADVRENASGPIMGENVGILLRAFEERILGLSPDHPDYRRLMKEMTMLRQEVRRLTALDEKPRTSIIIEIERILAAVRPPEIASVMCARGSSATFRGVDEIIDEGKIVVLDFAPQKQGLAAKLIVSGIRRQLFHRIVKSRGSGALPSDRPIVVLLDEAQYFLSFDEGEESDLSMAALSRSLKCRMWYSVQETGALFANAGVESYPLIHNFLRNIRTQVHLMQNFSRREFGEMLEERGIPWRIGLQFPTLGKFWALVISDDIGHRLVRLQPLHKIDEQVRLQHEEDRFRRTDALFRFEESEGRGEPVRLRTLFTSSIGSHLEDMMDRLENVLRDRDVPVLRVRAEELEEVDIAVLILRSARKDFRFGNCGVLLIDRMDLLAETLPGLRAIRTIAEARWLDMGMSELRFNIANIVIAASWVGEQRNPIGFGERSFHRSMPHLPKEIREKFNVVAIEEKIENLTNDVAVEDADATPSSEDGRSR